MAGGAVSDLFPSSAKIVTFKRLTERSFTANIQSFLVLFLFTGGGLKSIRNITVVGRASVVRVPATRGVLSNSVQGRALAAVVSIGYVQLQLSF